MLKYEVEAGDKRRQVERSGDNMNIKRAKEEIKNTIEAYLLKDQYGAYQIPIIRQRPILLI